MRVDQLTAQRQLRIMIYYLYLIKQIRFYFFFPLLLPSSSLFSLFRVDLHKKRIRMHGNKNVNVNTFLNIKCSIISWR